mmetsp:Transcript_90695/g.228059  ORF Transcript_90695/g.228059 Transcript_90695/m.228059 type:complete len:332 (+) Transcript_90695:56-1051(+)
MACKAHAGMDALGSPSDHLGRHAMRPASFSVFTPCSISYHKLFASSLSFCEHITRSPSLMEMDATMVAPVAIKPIGGEAVPQYLCTILVPLPLPLPLPLQAFLMIFFAVSCSGPSNRFKYTPFGLCVLTSRRSVSMAPWRNTVTVMGALLLHGTCKSTRSPGSILSFLSVSSAMLLRSSRPFWSCSCPMLMLSMNFCCCLPSVIVLLSWKLTLSVSLSMSARFCPAAAARLPWPAPAGCGRVPGGASPSCSSALPGAALPSESSRALAEAAWPRAGPKPASRILALRSSSSRSVAAAAPAAPAVEAAAMASLRAEARCRTATGRLADRPNH